MVRLRDAVVVFNEPSASDKNEFHGTDLECVDLVPNRGSGSEYPRLFLIGPCQSPAILSTCRKVIMFSQLRRLKVGVTAYFVVD